MPTGPGRAGDRLLATGRGRAHFVRDGDADTTAATGVAESAAVRFPSIGAGGHATRLGEDARDVAWRPLGQPIARGRAIASEHASPGPRASVPRGRWLLVPARQPPGLRRRWTGRGHVWRAGTCSHRPRGPTQGSVDACSLAIARPLAIGCPNRRHGASRASSPSLAAQPSAPMLGNRTAAGSAMPVAALVSAVPPSRTKCARPQPWRAS